MIKRLLLLLIALILLFMSGCYNIPGITGTSAGKIIPPPDKDVPLEGKWTVIEESGDRSNQWAGCSIQFAEDVVALDDTVWDKVSYKIKRVDIVAYLESKYISNSELFTDDIEEVDVITVYAADNYLGEAMMIDDDNIVFLVQDIELLLKKVADQTDNIIGQSITDSQNVLQNGNGKASGVLLGLRIPGETGYIYRTLWIASDQGQLHPVLMSENLFFPRTSGFWELRVSPQGEKGNILMARNVSARALEMDNEDEDVNEHETDSSEKIIEYIGNDYITITRNSAGNSRLQVLPVDKLSSSTEIKISDLLGEKGLNSFLSARDVILDELGRNGVRFFERDSLGTNFGLTRKNGHWILVGRINYQKEGTPDFSDFDLKMVPPPNLVYYDTLVLSWLKIKDRVPDAEDAFTSPNKDIAIVKTKNKLTVYKIGAEQLTENPLAELDLQEGAAVIMAEWATGSYITSWENSFLSYGARELSGSSVRIR